MPGKPGKCSKKEADGTETVLDAQKPPEAPPATTAAETVAAVTVPENAPKPPPEAPPVNEGFLPNMKEPGKGGCAFSPL